ncbi:MAG TPA: hypothetical protein VH062_21430 [Polyangiaceae bacterium]|jgi:hypothetical protein|nr:hypothetical protein [Polyangiaceae bacterium]
MLGSRSFPASLALLVSGALSLLSGAAHAGQSCKADSDCDHGFDCEVVGGTGCSNIACPPDAPCPPTPSCDPQVIKECVPGTCEAHSDCATDMVCYAQTPATTCGDPAPACAPGEKCNPPPEPTCTTEPSVNRCVPRWSLPCATDASCGDGFSCVPDPDSCFCNGSAGGGAPGSSGGQAIDGGSAVPTSPPDLPIPDPSATPTPPPGDTSPPSGCGCTPSTTKHCTPKATSCNADSDCPGSWTCGSSGGTACAGGAQVLPDGGIKVITDVCQPSAPTKQCQPPNYGGGYATPATGEGTVDVGSSPTTPSKSGSTGSAGGASGGSTSSMTHGIAGSSNDDNGAPESGKSPGSDSSGCQMSAAPAETTGASVIALLGVAGLIRRRRTRWG